MVSGHSFEREWVKTEVSLEKVYEEIKQMLPELKSIEKSLEYRPLQSFL
jgi:hypothetical protein